MRENDGKNHICESFLQWGNRKRMRCVKVEAKSAMDIDPGLTKKTTIRVGRRVVRAEKELVARCEDHHPVKPAVLSATVKKTTQSNHLHCSSSPEKIQREQPLNIISTRSNNTDDTNHKISTDAETIHDKTSNEAVVWPKFLISLSRKEKEEDFMAMKGSKLPLRPKKRAKHIQKIIHSVSPGGWLADLSPEWYEVKEKKSMKKRPRGLKAMGSTESDFE